MSPNCQFILLYIVPKILWNMLCRYNSCIISQTKVRTLFLPKSLLNKIRYFYYLVIHRRQRSSTVVKTFNPTHIMQLCHVALADIIIDQYIWYIVFRIPFHRSNDHWQSTCVLNSFSIVNNSPNYLVILYSMTKNSFTWHHCFIGGPCFSPAWREILGINLPGVQTVTRTSWYTIQ